MGPRPGRDAGCQAAQAYTVTSRFVPIPALALASELLPCCVLFVATAVPELLAAGPAGCVVAVALAIELEFSVFEFALTGRGGTVGCAWG
jgi:hypothetical protein